MSETTLILNDDSFDETIKEGITLVDFWAPWCGPCKVQGPIIDGLASEMGGKAKIAKLNVDEAPKVTEKYDVMSIPTLILYKNGEVVKTWVGVNKSNVLKSAIEKSPDFSDGINGRAKRLFYCLHNFILP